MIELLVRIGFISCISRLDRMCICIALHRLNFFCIPSYPRATILCFSVHAGKKYS